MKRYIFPVILIFLFFFASCDDPSRFHENYTPSYIERGYTIPHGVTRWDWNFSAGIFSDDVYFALDENWLDLFTFEFGVHDRVSISTLGIIIPYYVKYQPVKTDRLVIGSGGGISSFSRNRDEHYWYVSYNINGYCKFLLSDSAAIKLTNDFYWRTGSDIDDYLYDDFIMAGPLFQMTDKMAFSSAIGIQYSNSYFTDEEDYMDIYEMKEEFYCPYSLFFQWQINRQWEFQLTFESYVEEEFEEGYITLRTIGSW